MRDTRDWNLRCLAALPTLLALGLFLLASPTMAQDEPVPPEGEDVEAEEVPPVEEPPPADEAPEPIAPLEESPDETVEPPVEEPAELYGTSEEDVSGDDSTDEGPSEDVIDDTLEEEAEDLDAAEDEEVINVTGSRIGRSNLEDFASITVLDEEDIKMSGVTNIEQLIRYMPSVSLGGVSSSHPTGGGYAAVDLRNLGTGRTLTLLNGRRIASANLNSFPVAMIQRVDVLLEGASAVYGSDAIAGVVNIILKEDFEGFDIQANTGISSKGDGQKGGISATFGANGDNSNVTTNITYNHRTGILHKDRAWANPPCEDVGYNINGEIQSVCGSDKYPGGNAENLGYADIAGYNRDWGVGQYFVFQGEEADWHPMQPVYEVWQQQTDDGLIDTPYDIYNWGEQQALTGTLDTFSIISNGHHEINEFVTAYFEGIYSYLKNAGRYAGEPISQDGNDLYPQPLRVHFSNPFIPQDFWDQVIEPYGINYDQPNLQMRKRMNDVGARVFDDTLNTFRAVLGLRGEITPDYKWDVFFNYSRSQRVSITKNSPDMQRLHTTIDPELCYATPGCILANMFGEGTMQREVREWIGFDRTETSQWDQINPGGFVTMSPFELPGGKFTVVIGGDLRWETDQESPDSKVQDGLGGGTADEEYSAGYNSQEAFVELKAPILANVPGVHILEVNLAGRASHYNVFDTNLSYRAQLLYGPIPDFRLRGVLSTGFRAPTLTDLYGSRSTGYPSAQDPCERWGGAKVNPVTADQCTAEGVPDDLDVTSAQVRTHYGPNLSLQPETSLTVNLGTVITPRFMPKSLPLSVTFDWYNVTLFDAIENQTTADILRNCYEVEGLQSYCQYVERNQETHQISAVRAVKENIGEKETSGFDFTAQLGFPIMQNIRGHIAFQGNLLLEYIERNPDALTAGVPASVANRDFTGIIYPSGGGYPKFRFITALTIGDLMWQLSNRVRYFHGMKVDARADKPFPTVEAVAYWDIAGALTLGNFEWSLGCDNVLDREPPYIWGTGYNANVQVYDHMGRYFWTKLGYRFE